MVEKICGWMRYLLFTGKNIAFSQILMYSHTFTCNDPQHMQLYTIYGS